MVLFLDPNLGLFRLGLTEALGRLKFSVGMRSLLSHELIGLGLFLLSAPDGLYRRFYERSQLREKANEAGRTIASRQVRQRLLL
jgi:hypothetical protein